MTETLGYGEGTGIERTICHEAPTGGCQIDVAIAIEDRYVGSSGGFSMDPSTDGAFLSSASLAESLNSYTLRSGHY